MLEIRKIKREDFDEVLAMMRVFYDSPAVNHTSSDKVLIKDIEDCLDENLPILDGYVFLVDNAYAGYAMTALNYTTEYGGISVWVEDLYIKPEYRRQGIAAKFLARIEKDFPEAVRFKLEVEEANSAAITTYKHSGYVVSPYLEMTKEMIED